MFTSFTVHPLNKLPYSKLDSKSVGVKEGVVFLTYSSLIASSEKGRSRLQQLVQWCGSEFDGLVIFDEVSFTWAVLKSFWLLFFLFLFSRVFEYGATYGRICSAVSFIHVITKLRWVSIAVSQGQKFGTWSWKSTNTNWWSCSWYSGISCKMKAGWSFWLVMLFVAGFFC